MAITSAQLLGIDVVSAILVLAGAFAFVLVLGPVHAFWLLFFAMVAWASGSLALTGTFQLGRLIVDASGMVRLACWALAPIGIIGIGFALRAAWITRALGHHITPDGVLRNRGGRPVR